MPINEVITTNESLGGDESINYRKKLEDKFSDIQKKERVLNSNKIIIDNKSKLSKDKAIQKLFKMMEDAGVDLNSQESISEFLKKLEEQNPDLKQLFEEAFNAIIGEEGLPVEGLPVEQELAQSEELPGIPEGPVQPGIPEMPPVQTGLAQSGPFPPQPLPV